MPGWQGCCGGCSKSLRSWSLMVLFTPFRCFLAPVFNTGSDFGTTFCTATVSARSRFWRRRLSWSMFELVSSWQTLRTDQAQWRSTQLGHFGKSKGARNQWITVVALSTSKVPTVSSTQATVVGRKTKRFCIYIIGSWHVEAEIRFLGCVDVLLENHEMCAGILVKGISCQWTG